MEHYERLEKIGEGASGVVYKARDRRTGAVVAVKRLRGCCQDDDQQQLAAAFLRESRCLEACRGHPSLVELRAAHLDAAAGAAFLVMEYVGPSLAQVMRERGDGRPFPEAEARRLMRQLLEGARAMHDSLGVLHRDLKPDNVLVDGHGGLKICDFGMSRFAAVAPTNAEYTSPVVTLWYRAPELLLGSRGYDAGVDTWALGCIMAELLSGAPLFPGRSEMDQLNKVFDAVGMKRWPGFARLPRAGSPLCDGRGRPQGRRLREMFPDLSDAGFDVLSGLLDCSPDTRLTAADALRRPWFTDADSPDQPPARNACGTRFAAAARVGGAPADAIVV